LRFLPEAETNTVLADTLALGGSAWMVAPDGKSLVRRIDPTAVEQFALATSPNHVASQKLAEAWGYAYGRQPNASYAWSDAIKAVEALLIPLVCPNKQKANLGGVAGDLKSAPHAWELVLEGTNGIWGRSDP